MLVGLQPIRLVIPRNPEAGNRNYRRPGAGCSRWSVPLPNFSERVVEPSDQVVIVPLPNGRVWPVTVRPSRARSVVSEPEPNGCVRVVDPSDQVVIVPLPKVWVCPVTVRPSRARSVVSAPEPNGCVRLLEPSDLFVSVPEPNRWVWPVRGCPALLVAGGCTATSGVAAATSETIKTTRPSRRPARPRTVERDARMTNPRAPSGMFTARHTVAVMQTRIDGRFRTA
jgi:hypothetical protein